jgi:hypothetical protein
MKTKKYTIIGASVIALISIGWFLLWTLFATPQWSRVGVIMGMILPILGMIFICRLILDV